MSLRSMTGFSSSQKQCDGFELLVEAKSVNGKGLDVRCRAPGFLNAFDIKAKKLAAKYLRRGNISINLSVRPLDETATFTVNEERLNSLLSLAHKLEGHVGVQAAHVDGLLSLPGVIENGMAAMDNDQCNTILEHSLRLLEEALGRLNDVRAVEGEALQRVLCQQISEIERLVRDAAQSSDAQLGAIRDRLGERVNELLDTRKLDEHRLEQELALLAIKYDVREELDRLNAHIAEARKLLDSQDAVGRRLDFLAQEFNREANTLCAKAAGTALTRIGLDLKTTIDQMREQIQNVE